MENKSLLYITNLPVPYRVDFFNLLTQKINLFVIFERKKAKNRNSEWLKKVIKFNHMFLRSFWFSTENSISFGIIFHLFKKQYDYIVFGGYGSITSLLTIFIMIFLKKEYILNIDGYINHPSKVKNFFKQIIFNKAKMILTTSNISLNSIKTISQNPNIFIYPLSCMSKNDQKLREKSLLTRKNKFIKPIKLISIGQFIYRKGFDILIEAISKIGNKGNFELLIVGGKPLLSYKKMINERNLHNVTFLEFQNKENLENIYLKSDILIIPSREDIWGLVVNEALSFGLPVISSNRTVSGLSLINNGKNGYIYSYDSPKDLAKIITYFSTLSHTEINNLKESSLNSIKNHNYEKMVDIHLNIIEKHG